MLQRILHAVGLAKSDPGACGRARSPHWPAVEKAFLNEHPACAVCGGTQDLNVHHKRPFHLRPELELDPANLITLCRPHHLLVGHLMNWASYNPAVEPDAQTWMQKIKTRPATAAAAALIVLAMLFGCLAAFGQADVGQVVEGGPVGPDGKTEVACDLPVELRLKNVGGRDGAGLCVFTSIEHCGRWQNVPALVGFQAKMRQEPGGGYPQKVDAMMAKYAPGVRYVQHTGGDLNFIRQALRTGRMVGVTYAGHDPHYGNQTIAHMVDAVYLDDRWACVLDNNFIGEKQLVWMSAQEFADRWLGQKFTVPSRRGPQPVGGGWAIVLLDCAPPPVPRVTFN